MRHLLGLAWTLPMHRRVRRSWRVTGRVTVAYARPARLQQDCTEVRKVLESVEHAHCVGPRSVPRNRWPLRSWAVPPTTSLRLQPGDRGSSGVSSPSGALASCAGGRHDSRARSAPAARRRHGLGPPVLPAHRPQCAPRRPAPAAAQDMRRGAAVCDHRRQLGGPGDGARARPRTPPWLGPWRGAGGQRGRGRGRGARVGTRGGMQEAGSPAPAPRLLAACAGRSGARHPAAAPPRRQAARP